MKKLNRILSISFYIFLGIYLARSKLSTKFDDQNFNNKSLNFLIRIDKAFNLKDASNNNNHKQVHWKVTENGFFYCKINCLLLEDKVSFTEKQLPKSNLSHNQSLSFLNTYHLTTPQKVINGQKETLECKPFAHYTQYDFLIGIETRDNHKSLPEPDLIHIFDRSGQLKLRDLRQRLLRMKKENKLNRVVIYNRIGNFNRIIGDPLRAIECFRKALYLEPYNSDVLINMARLFLKLKLYEDSLFLTKKSLDSVRSDKSPWLQHFTLAEILNENNYVEEALMHLKKTLYHKPNYKHALKLLQDINSQSQCRSNNFTFIENYLNELCTVSPTLNFSTVWVLIIFGILIGLFNAMFDVTQKLELSYTNNSKSVSKNKVYKSNFKSNKK